MPARVRLERAPSTPRQSYETSKELSRALELSLSDVRAVLGRAPFTLPRDLEADEAMALQERLRSLGAEAHVLQLSSTIATRCGRHPRLDGTERCRTCDAAICVACAARPTPSGEPLCDRCTRSALKKHRRYRARLVVWFVLLAAVCLYGLREWRGRRPDWTRPTRVALVLLAPKDGTVDPSALEGFQQRVPALEERLREEAAKYLPAPASPFELFAHGPVEQEGGVPKLKDDSFLSLLRFNFDLWRFARDVDRTAPLDADDFDVRIYVSARRPAVATRQSVEGASQDGGSIGVVEVELAPDSIDFALFVAAHELLHTRGASDKYGSDGLALLPSGYADPHGVPLYPQRGTEVMARGRPVAPGMEAPPIDLAELTVGPETASEIAWLTPHTAER